LATYAGWRTKEVKDTEQLGPRSQKMGTYYKTSSGHQWASFLCVTYEMLREWITAGEVVTLRFIHLWLLVNCSLSSTYHCTMNDV